MEFGQTKNFAKLIYLISRFFSPGLFKFSGILCICLFTNAFLFSVNKIRPGLPKHNMSTFVRSSTSRSSLKHRLFAPNPDENEMDDEEDDDEFEQYVKKNEIKENSMITSKPVEEENEEKSSSSDAADWSTRLIFQCRLCQKQCDGFHMAVSHFKHVHPLAEELEPEVDDSKEDPQQVQSNEKAEEQCPLCPKVFRKIDNLKVHVWRHVNRAFPGIYIKRKKKLIFVFTRIFFL